MCTIKQYIRRKVVSYLSANFIPLQPSHISPEGNNENTLWITLTLLSDTLQHSKWDYGSHFNRMVKSNNYNRNKILLKTYIITVSKVHYASGCTHACMHSSDYNYTTLIQQPHQHENLATDRMHGIVAVLVHWHGKSPCHNHN
jgi:hypothetical protein